MEEKISDQTPSDQDNIPPLRITIDSLGRNVMIAMVVLISSLMVSNILYHILRADTLVEQFSSSIGIATFVVLTIIPFGVGFYLLRKFIAPLNKELMHTKAMLAYFRITYSILKIALISNAILLSVIVLQLSIWSKFNVGLTILSMQPNVILTTVIFSYSAYKFIKWFRLSRDLTVLFFGLTFAAIALGIASSGAAQTAAFLLEDIGRTEESIADLSEAAGYADAANIKANPFLHAAYVATQLPLRIAFVLYWIATAMLLRKYSQKIGRLRFWTLVGLPLLTFIIGSIFTYGDLVPQLYQGIILSSASLFGGILFGLIFLTIARALGKRTGAESNSPAQGKRSSDISRYLIMSVFGTILFLITNNPTNHIIDWVHVPYPPYADVVWSFIGFAAYLYSFGLFFSAIAISQDTSLRKSLKKLAMEEAEMLKGLGSTRMQEELEKKVAKISKEQEERLMEQTGIQHEVSDEEMKQYAKEVARQLQELSQKK
jgi:hypothetical protein